MVVGIIRTTPQDEAGMGFLTIAVRVQAGQAKYMSPKWIIHSINVQVIIGSENGNSGANLPQDFLSESLDKEQVSIVNRGLMELK